MAKASKQSLTEGPPVIPIKVNAALKEVKAEKVKARVRVPAAKAAEKETVKKEAADTVSSEIQTKLEVTCVYREQDNFRERIRERYPGIPDNVVEYLENFKSHFIRGAWR
jgi:hypothetical protein